MSLRYPSFDAIWYGEALRRRDLGPLLCNELFTGVSKRYVNEHRDYFRRSTLRARTVMLYDGDEAQRVYLILRGRVVAAGYVRSILGAGNFFGEASLFSALVAGTITTSSECDLASISKPGLHHLINEQPVIATNVARILSGYVIAMYETLFGAPRQPNDGATRSFLEPRPDFGDWFNDSP